MLEVSTREGFGRYKEYFGTAPHAITVYNSVAMKGLIHLQCKGKPSVAEWGKYPVNTAGAFIIRIGFGGAL